MELFLTELSDFINQPIFDRLMSKLNEKDRSRILKFRNPSDQQRTLMGRIILERVLKKNFKNDLLQNLHFDSYGRPYQNQIPNIDFNISHSGKFVACGLSDHGRVGVDVEEIKSMNTEISSQVLTSEELYHLAQLPKEKKQSAFFHFWTLKESYLKAKGCTFEIPLDSFWFDISQASAPIFNSKGEPNEKKWSFKSFFIDPEYVLSICGNTPPLSCEPVLYNQNEMIKSALSEMS